MTSSAAGKSIEQQLGCSADGVGLPHLLVVPLSTVTNWEREFALWAPHLNVVTLIGNSAARDNIREHELYVDGGCKKTRDRSSLQVLPSRLSDCHSAIMSNACCLSSVRPNVGPSTCGYAMTGRICACRKNCDGDERSVCLAAEGEGARAGDVVRGGHDGGDRAAEAGVRGTRRR